MREIEHFAVDRIERLNIELELDPRCRRPTKQRGNQQRAKHPFPAAHHAAGDSFGQPSRKWGSAHRLASGLAWQPAVGGITTGTSSGLENNATITVYAISGKYLKYRPRRLRRFLIRHEGDAPASRLGV